MSDHTVPDWIHPGAPVAMYRHGGGFGNSVTLTKVERLTATQVVLANGRRYRRDNLRREVGSSTGFYSSCELMPTTEPKVRRALARGAADQLRYDMDELLKRLDRAADTADLLATLDKAAEMVAGTRARVTELDGAA